MSLPEYDWFVPVQTKNPLNTRETFWLVSKRGKREKAETLRCAPEHRGVTFPIVAVLTRRSTQLMDRADGVRASLKHVIDAVAEWAGIDDGDPEFHVHVRQGKCRRGEAGVEIRIIQNSRLVTSIERVEA